MFCFHAASVSILSSNNLPTKKKHDFLLPCVFSVGLQINKQNRVRECTVSGNGCIVSWSCYCGSGNCVLFDCVCERKRLRSISRVVYCDHIHRGNTISLPSPNAIQTCSPACPPCQQRTQSETIGYSTLSPSPFPLASPRPSYLPTLKPLPNPIAPNLLPLHLRPRNRQLPPQPLETALRQLHERPIQVLLIRFLCRCDCFHNVRCTTAAGGG